MNKMWRECDGRMVSLLNIFFAVPSLVNFLNILMPLRHGEGWNMIYATMLENCYSFIVITKA